MAGSARPRQIPRFARNDSIQRPPHEAQPRAAHGGLTGKGARMADKADLQNWVKDCLGRLAEKDR